MVELRDAITVLHLELRMMRLAQVIQVWSAERTRWSSKHLTGKGPRIHRPNHKFS